MIPKLILSKIVKFSAKFEETYEIPYILGTIDGNYLLIVAPKIDFKSYYCFKKLLFNIDLRYCDKKCLF